jgi:hypothetical protein
VLVVIRNEETLSSKTNFIIHLIHNQNPNNRFFYVFKKESNKFEEKWHNNEVQLPSTALGLIIYYSLIMLKSPKDARNGLMARLSIAKRAHLLIGSGFLSTLSRTLYLRFGTSARVNKLFRFLDKVNSPRIFVIDEFLSLKCVDLKKLKLLGPLIYVSQDIAYNRFGFGDHSMTRKLMFSLERTALSDIDLVVACSEMERLKYLEMGAKKAIFYPNMYPTEELEPCEKDEIPSISIVLREHWGHRAEDSLETIFNALARIDEEIRVYMIGIRPKIIPRNVNLVYSEFVPSKLEYLKILSKSWIGINVGIHKAGTNERKYDYAESGAVVLSDTLGARGDLLPYEYTYVDSQDLAAKMEQLFEFGKTSLREMGEKNRNYTLSLAEKQRDLLLTTVSKITANTNR